MKNNIINALLLLIAPLLIVSCSQEWDEHFNAEVTEKSELSIFEYIKSKPELSVFAQMVEMTGYDKLLSENQTFTVWAPVNTSLVGFNLNDEEEVLKTVRNHITRFSVPSSGIQTRTMLMLNNKLLNFARTPSGLQFGGKTIVQNDIAVKNGIIHIVNEYVPYTLNIWEYIAVAPDIDSLRNYINGLTRLEFDVDQSYLDGVLIDSVFTPFNKVLSSLGRFTREDSVYTALLPDNAAWNTAYSKIYPHFKALDEDGGLQAQVENTRWMMVKDLFFSGRRVAPLNSDSIGSTSRTLLTNANEIIPSSTPEELSNGIAYTVSELKHKPVDSWKPVIRIEAENTQFGRTSGNYEITTFSSIGTGFNVSGGRYINARATSTLSTARLFVNFPIPNTLAGKYNVYVVFVPMYITDTTNVRPYRVRFSISTDYRPQGTNTEQWVGPNGFVTAFGQARQFTTEPTEMTKLLVLENYQFPYANIVNTNTRSSDLIGSDKIRVALRVENAVGTTASERLNFNRDIRIDCILLEPVE